MAGSYSSLMVEFKKNIKRFQAFNEQPRVFESQASQGTNYYLSLGGIWGVPFYVSISMNVLFSLIKKNVILVVEFVRGLLDFWLCLM